MKVSILDGCIVCGVCSSINSDVFEFDEDHINVHEESMKNMSKATKSTASTQLSTAP